MTYSSSSQSSLSDMKLALGQQRYQFVKKWTLTNCWSVDDVMEDQFSSSRPPFFCIPKVQAVFINWTTAIHLDLARSGETDYLVEIA